MSASHPAVPHNADSLRHASGIPERHGTRTPGRIVDLWKDTLQALDEALSTPVQDLKGTVAGASRSAVRLRDEVIMRLRQEAGAPEDVPALRAVLERANVALSLITGVNYPAAGVSREKLEQARYTLLELASSGWISTDVSP